MSPGQYIVKVDRASGEPLADPIEPGELLVHAHRDHHPVEIAAQFLASRLIHVTGNESLVKKGLKGIEFLGARVGRTVGRAHGEPGGRRAREAPARRRRRATTSSSSARRRISRSARSRRASQELQKQARAQLAALGKRPRLKVLLTGATGFVGKEFLAQAASHPYVEEVVSVVRPETMRDRKTKQVVKVLSARERGALLLKRLHLSGKAAARFRFIEGDVEKPDFGIEAKELERLRKELTHVVHCAASVSFDDPYPSSFRANVLGCKNALAFSKRVQAAPGSRFVAHVAIETSYIHGRRKRSIAQEDALQFPRHFYNNYYELTKAMASIETDRALVRTGLRVTQLLPSIVIGHTRTGNNRGDTKVLNAPVNAFGRAQEALAELGRDAADRLRALVVGRIATSFPADRSAELNLVPVDRVATGILASLTAPEAIGARIHLATDNRIRSEDICRIAEEELGVKVRMTDPTLSRNVTLPLYKAVLLGGRGPQARERRREAGLDLRRLRRVGSADPRRGQRRPPARACRSGVRRPPRASGCCAGTTSTSRSSPRCATPTRSRGASGSGRRRSKRSNTRPAARWRRSLRASSASCSRTGSSSRRSSRADRAWRGAGRGRILGSARPA